LVNSPFFPVGGPKWFCPLECAHLSGWAAPHELEIFDGCLEDEEVEKTDELGE